MNRRSSLRYEILAMFFILGVMFILSQTVHCEGITWSGPKLAPAEAAKVMAQAPGLANRTNAPAPLPEEGPTVVILSGSATAGPFGQIATPRLPVHPPCCFNFPYGFYQRPPSLRRAGR